MKQCPNCKCQIGSGVAMCPYCGTQVPVEDEYSNIQGKPRESADNERTHIQYQYVYTTPRTGAEYGAKPVVCSDIQQVPYYMTPCNSCIEHEKSQSTIINVLVILVVSLVAANIFALAALLLCLR